ncbi:MAG: ribulose-phosphate 3-epimerase [Acidobacteria bacterium]|nr:ribulose-phosphate 3-epimerase [Acidobacteriota bacterium]
MAPSLLSADFAALGASIRVVEDAGADLLHVDVMDGHFVPNITIGPPVVKAVKRVTGLPLDVHLMIERPDDYLEAFVEAGASLVSVHVEVLAHLHRTLHRIKALGARAGVVLNPATPVSAIEEVVGDLDFVLVMSVNPGFGGQRFIARSVEKIRAIRQMLDAAGRDDVAIEVDGGIDATTAPLVVAAGASMLVAGNAIFAQPDPPAAMARIRAAALGAAR